MTGKTQKRHRYKNDIEAGDRFFVGMTYDRYSSMDFHVKVWRMCQPELSKNAVDMLTEGDVTIDSTTFEKTRYSRVAVCFKEQKDYDQFKQWFDKYESRFKDKDDMENLTPGVDGQFIQGYMVEHSSLLDARSQPKASDAVLYEWAWIVRNTTGKVYWTPLHWIFEHSEEAVLYKLKSSGSIADSYAEEEDEEDDYGWDSNNSWDSPF